MKERINTTYKIHKLLEQNIFTTKKSLAAELDMSRPTLDSRLNGKTDWRKLEKHWINYIYKKLITKNYDNTRNNRKK